MNKTSSFDVHSMWTFFLTTKSNVRFRAIGKFELDEGSLPGPVKQERMNLNSCASTAELFLTGKCEEPIGRKSIHFLCLLRSLKIVVNGNVHIILPPFFSPVEQSPSLLGFSHRERRCPL